MFGIKKHTDVYNSSTEIVQIGVTLKPIMKISTMEMLFFECGVKMHCSELFYRINQAVPELQNIIRNYVINTFYAFQMQRR